jgi:hypothetical protein
MTDIEIAVSESVRIAHEVNQRNWATDAEALPEFSGKDNATLRREALIETLDKMDAQRRARDVAAAGERAKAEATQQLSAIASRKAELEAELAALATQAETLAAVAAPKKPKAKE